jgi:acetyl-CoA acetyltransferase
MSVDRVVFVSCQPGKLMGVFAEDAARDRGFAREAQNAHALESFSRARSAIANGPFASEVTAVQIKTRHGATAVDRDEEPGRAQPERTPGLRPALVKDGADTAANSSSISDGAAALGHPVGASGARILVTRLAALEARQRRGGAASLGLGGGEATAVAIELM